MKFHLKNSCLTGFGLFGANRARAVGFTGLVALLIPISAHAEAAVAPEGNSHPQNLRLASQGTGQRPDLRYRRPMPAQGISDTVAVADPVSVARPAALVQPASITTGALGSQAMITVGVTTVSGSITYGRAMDAAGAPVDFSRMRRFSIAKNGSPLSLSSISMPSGMPVTSAYLSSRYGMRINPVLGTLRAHTGIDLAAPLGTPIMATSDGVVQEADWRGGYGLMVALDHGGGVQTRYGHMSRLNVAPGQPVSKGDVIGYVGSTGRSTGPHVHYEMRFNGQAVNPLSRITR